MSAVAINGARVTLSNKVGAPTVSCDVSSHDSMMSRDLVLGHACSSHVKVVLRHILGRADLHASVSGCKLVT